MSKLTRRDFFIRSSQIAIGTAVGIAALESVAQAQNPTPTPVPGTAVSPALTPTATPDPTGWPWKYVKLDPQVVAQKAYDSYYQAGCMYGAFHAIISALKETYGPPYNLIPTMMARYGKGGGVEWGSLCGALNGSALAMNLVLSDFTPPINELFGWYTKTALPIFKPATPKVEISTTSVSDSVLCHPSVTLWCDAAKVKSETPQRSERCGRLTADVAARAVQILNDYADGKFKSSYVANQSVQTCGVCHTKGGIVENVRTQMDCVQCHTPNSLPTTHPK
ncbi:Split-Soret cytochrome c [Anaerolineae bacterium]|nr:Split-Soret cytochrome c [Anaerolineae bacterium]